MENNLNLEKSHIPFYHQLEQIIKSQIVIGQFVPGEQIPTERELCEIYGVSSITARQAILNLVKEGVVVRRQGKGTFVTEKMRDIKTVETLQFTGHLEDMIPQGLEELKIEVLDIVNIKAPRKIAELLDMKEGQEVTRVRRVRNDNDMPVTYTQNYFPLEIGERIKKEDLSKYPPIYILRDQLGIQIGGAIQYIEAIVADKDIASSLSVSMSSPILYFEATISDRAEKPVQHIRTFYKPDRFRFAVKASIGFDL